MTGRLATIAAGLVLAGTVLAGCGGLQAGDRPGSGEGAASSSPTCPPGTSCGSDPIDGLGARKQAILAAGGDVLDVAVAMLETESMTTTYPYGDDKSDDAGNFGLFKQNWHMLRHACTQFRSQPTSQWNSGAALNGDLDADVSCLNQSQRYYGIDLWFAGHRNGETGLNHPDTADIDRYRTAVYWIRDQISAESANLTNDTRFWVDVPAI